ncbi:MAG: reverse transcriptase domain-containing protein [Bacteroidales bacterium]|nr:reverse transcriptase domain-containing protein [Bacteroidales bacterium]
MKRENNLITLIADPDNLRLAFWKARKAKEGKIEVAEFRKCLDKNLLSLRNELLTGNVVIGDYQYFTIYDPKERLICDASFRERVLHHALMNVCHENFEKYQIFDSYASRIGKGTYAAIERAKIFQKKYRWFLKLDVRKYFDSINHAKLKVLLTKRFKDKMLLQVFFQIIESYSTGVGKGLPIGNLTSQYFANHYLAVADHYIKEKIQAPAYVRYMDDMVIWSDDKTKLLNIGKDFQAFIESELRLTLKPFCLNSSEKGLPFLGYTIYPEKVLLNGESRNRFVVKMKNYYFKLNTNVWDQKEYQNHVIPLIAFINHANSFGLRQKLMQTIENG